MKTITSLVGVTMFLWLLASCICSTQQIVVPYHIMPIGSLFLTAIYAMLSREFQFVMLFGFVALVSYATLAHNPDDSINVTCMIGALIVGGAMLGSTFAPRQVIIQPAPMQVRYADTDTDNQIKNDDEKDATDATDATDDDFYLNHLVSVENVLASLWHMISLKSDLMNYVHERMQVLQNRNPNCDVVVEDKSCCCGCYGKPAWSATVTFSNGVTENLAFYSNKELSSLLAWVYVDYMEYKDTNDNDNDTQTATESESDEVETDIVDDERLNISELTHDEFVRRIISGECPDDADADSEPKPEAKYVWIESYNGEIYTNIVCKEVADTVYGDLEQLTSADAKYDYDNQIVFPTVPSQVAIVVEPGPRRYVAITLQDNGDLDVSLVKKSVLDQKFWSYKQFRQDALDIECNTKTNKAVVIVE